MRKFCILFLCVCLCLSHVSAQGEERIVTRVEVRYDPGDRPLFRQYTAQDKMAAILSYLRLCKFDGMPTDNPEDHTGSRCQIALTLADGGSRTYYLHAERYLSKDGRPWEKIRPPDALLPLLLAFPSDA